MRSYTKMGAKQYGPNSGETAHRERTQKRGGFATTGAKVADQLAKAEAAAAKALAEAEAKLAADTAKL